MEREILSKNIREREGVQCLRAMDNDYIFAKELFQKGFHKKFGRKEILLGNPPGKSSPTFIFMT